ncbi:tetratricopeptide repeat protein [Flavobacterium sp. GCM10027622]|uniref:tetratricopeptide repeat protein n=1 Tax=unclassified Flavobacterium TaxID=196869 RepID=UPI00362437C0
MKPIIQAFLFFVITSTAAQNNLLEFKNKIYECENKWVTYPLKEKDSVYALGYVYIDRDAGFSFHSEKKFKIAKDGKFIPQPKSSISKVISRIQQFDAICAVIPEAKFKELGITSQPVFMKSIVVADESEDLVLRASHYNHIGASLLAIPLLEKAQKINPNAKNLLYELVYSFNDNGDFKKVIGLLQPEISKGNNDPLFYKEFIFALAKEGQLEDATVAFSDMKKITSLKHLDDASYYIMEGYFVKKDAEKFEEWAKEALSHITSTNSPLRKNIDVMRNDLKQ